MNKYVTAAAIKRLREQKGLSQSELAKRLSVSPKTVSKWETGRGYPDITLLSPIAAELGISTIELLSGAEVINQNRVGNMRRSKFYVCPVCGNVIHSLGNAVVSCCGILLPEIEAESADDSHKISITTVEDEYFVTADHPMTKSHYISFFAAVGDDFITVKKLYPEGNAEARFKKNGVTEIFAFCNRDGMQKQKI